MFVKVLPPEVVSKISAGEVVESPTDVVKELVENSLDAKATEVVVEISKGGKRYVKVRDNGTGIHPQDIEKVILRNATSKLEDEKQLYGISSYGFRGEALYAISSVSLMRLKSRFFQEDTGYELICEAGRVKEKREVGMSVGTSVEVHELFFNMPARRRFLRKADTEKRGIKRLLLSYALSNPGVGFTLISEGRVLLELKSEDYEERIGSLFGEGFELLEGEESGIRVRAYVRRNEQKSESFIFVNSRPVFNRNLKEFIRKLLGYKTLSILYIEMPPFMVEQNVHPKKHEVRFVKERKVLEVIRKALTEKGDNLLYSDFLSQEPPRYGEEVEVVGQLMDALVVVRIGEYLYFFDQHLLSERINYERLPQREEGAQIACRSAIKKGESLETHQILEMVKEWKRLQNPHVCPHGRPIYYRIHMSEILSKIDRNL